MLQSVISPYLDLRRGELTRLLADAVVHGDMSLSSGRRVGYYLDTPSVLLHGDAMELVGNVVAEQAVACGAVAVGGPTIGASALCCGALHYGVDSAFLIRAEPKLYGAGGRISGAFPADVRASVPTALIVDDVVSTGHTLLDACLLAIDHGWKVVGAFGLVDRGKDARGVLEQAGISYTYAVSMCDLGFSP
jgi:orotate phosphoribosyltransferase